MPRRFRIVALSVWPGLAQIWSGQEVLGLLARFILRIGAESRHRVPLDLDRGLRDRVGRISWRRSPCFRG